MYPGETGVFPIIRLPYASDRPRCNWTGSARPDGPCQETGFATEQADSSRIPLCEVDLEKIRGDEKGGPCWYSLVGLASAAKR